ncbi:MAG: hypothetical protein V3T99_05920 [Nitrososphaerales archaeon]
MLLGRIVAIHGRNISIIANKNESDTAREIEITLPAVDETDIDYAILSLGDGDAHVTFSVHRARIWFPDKQRLLDPKVQESQKQ